ncbi:MAG: dihydroneopterin aldolase [Actinobacteria bacterium]|jgi:7,8-dihydroneopterin aldolase/epimerase/oxygenase|uniref:dihydroneopterin aldolase n=1 Tax=freshwater metagenome TaxID=449393 RepID=A0A6J7K8W5_9ZZZZ|nr:dihydroneopterin aldolase [Actinomycetota bacterium]MSW42036.1 dihydroneopterin aldolase [Actinomycetota bacterium]
MSAPPDRIALTGLRAFGYHGVLEHERRDGQEFVVDVVLHVDTHLAAETDDLAHTINYADVADQVHALITGDPADLIETLAAHIAAACLTDTRVGRVEVTVHKPSAPVEVTFADISVSIVRTQAGTDSA